MLLPHHGLLSQAGERLAELFVSHLQALLGIGFDELLSDQAERELQNRDEEEELGEGDHTVIV